MNLPCQLPQTRRTCGPRSRLSPPAVICLPRWWCPGAAGVLRHKFKRGDQGRCTIFCMLQQRGDLLVMARDAVHAGAFYAGTQYRYYFALVSDSDAAKIDNTFTAPAPPVR